jgi:hypothetical protein
MCITNFGLHYILLWEYYNLSWGKYAFFLSIPCHLLWATEMIPFFLLTGIPNGLLKFSIYNYFIHMQGSPHIVKTGRLDFSLSWLKGEVRENLGDFRKSIKILTFLSPLPHIPLPFTKTNNDLKRMQLTSLE